MLEKKGLVKLIEESGELVQVAAKKITRMDSDEHWDNAGLLSVRLQDEIADVLAAIQIVTENLELNITAIQDRAVVKYELFKQWQNEEN